MEQSRPVCVVELSRVVRFWEYSHLQYFLFIFMTNNYPSGWVDFLLSSLGTSKWIGLLGQVGSFYRSSSPAQASMLRHAGHAADSVAGQSCKMTIDISERQWLVLKLDRNWTKYHCGQRDELKHAAKQGKNISDLIFS